MEDFGPPYYTSETAPPPESIDIGRYVIQAPLIPEPTNCSYVYLCFDKVDNQKKVIKFNKLSLKKKGQIGNEIKTLRCVNHANIIRLEDYFRFDAYMCLIFPFTPHRSIETALSNQYQQGIPEEIVVNMAYQMLQAVNYLHEMNIWHRDIKTDNFLLFDSPQNTIGIQNNQNFPLVVLTDFGFARFFNQDEQGYQTMGTTEYMSPELYEGKPYDKSVDIWALGITFFKMLTNRFPFSKPKKLPKSFKKRIFRGCLNFDILTWLYISPDCIDLIRKMCAYDPSQRITAKDALLHPWITSISGENKSARENDVAAAIGQSTEFIFTPGT